MKRVRIAVDANEANVANRVGSNIYAYKLLQELERLTRDTNEFSFTVYVSSSIQADFPKQRAGWKYVVLTPRYFWTQWRFPLELFVRQRAFDFVLSLGHYAPRFCRLPTVVCIMDLAFLQFPQFFRKKDLYQLTEWTRYSVEQAFHVITISQNSKVDIIEEYGRGSEEISLVYPGVMLPTGEKSEHSDEKILSHFGVEKDKYVVSVGTIQPRKNMIHLVHAFEAVALKNSEVKLVFVGKSGWLTTEFEEVVSSSLAKERIIVTGFVSEEEKYALLRNSKASILVGFYEGFGIPAIESMGVGVVPVVANTASLPEVVGELGIMVDPYSIEDIARGLQEAIDHKTSFSLQKQLKDRARSFSWEKSGTDLVSVLKDIYDRLGH